VLEYIQKNLLSTVYMGPQGFQMFNSEVEQKKVQLKFSSEHGWHNDWFVVGVDTELGDPYFMIKSSNDAFIYTGVFDGEKWELIPVAESTHAFVECLTAIRKANNQKVEVFVPDDSTLIDRDILQGLEELLIDTSKCEEFWQQFFVCYIDWLEEE
jgi:hypothetical protein